VLFVPLWDKNHLKTVHFQYITLIIVLINIAVHILFRSGLFPEIQLGDDKLGGLAVVPERLMSSTVFNIGGPQGDYGFGQVPAGFSLITYQFLHNDIVHLATNMLFLWVFGDNVEDAVGHVKFIFFYLLCGIFGGLAQCIAQPGTNSLLIGASGSIAGIIGAYLMLHPHVRVWVLVLFKIPLRLSAGFILGGWILLQIGYLVMGPASNVSWWTHIGGFVAGALLIIIMRRPHVPLFDGATGDEPHSQ
jgi:membrane associated rhomboid family serine protease